MITWMSKRFSPEHVCQMKFHDLFSCCIINNNGRVEITIEKFHKLQTLKYNTNLFHTDCQATLTHISPHIIWAAPPQTIIQGLKHPDLQLMHHTLSQTEAAMIIGFQASATCDIH